MTNWNVLFSTGRTEWGTPWPLYNALDDIFHFNLDVCACRWNAKCTHYIDPRGGQDGLATSWHDYFGPRAKMMLWMNPPYGQRIIVPWVRKMEESWKQGAEGVALVPARTDTAWFQDVVFQAPMLYFLKGRLPFQLPCAIHIEGRTSLDGCMKMSSYLYRRLYVPGAEYFPVCEKHAEELRLRSTHKRLHSTSTFPSCLAFYMHHWGEGRMEGLRSLAEKGYPGEFVNLRAPKP